MDTIEQYVKRFENLKSERFSWEDHWQDLAKYVIPRKAYINQVKTPGQKVSSSVYDSTAIKANKILAAGLHGYLTNPASRWFALRTQRKSLMEAREVKIWFKEVEDEIYNTLNSSNFDQQIHELYLDLPCFGTAGLYQEEDEAQRVRFRTIPISELFIIENSRGFVDTVYREFEYTVSQAYERWSNKVGEEIVKAYKEGKYEEKFTFIHVVEPRYERQAGKSDVGNMPYRSLFIEKKKKRLVHEGGYREFPYYVPRFDKESGEVYGASPAQTALPDIKMLNKMEYTILRSGMKITDPPMVLPHDGFVLPLNFNPGKLNYSVSGTDPATLQPIKTGGNIPIAQSMTDQKRISIQEMFFVDLFRMLMQLKKQMTVPEVVERVAEKMLLLGPTLGRLMNELLDPIIVRTFNILMRKGLLPPMPMQLQNVDYVVEYISPLAKAQRQSEISSMNQALSIIGEIAKFNAEVLDKIDGDKTVDMIIDIHGVNPDIVRDDEEVQAIRETRAQAVQEAEQIMKAQQAAEIAAKASQAEKNAQPAGVK